MKQSFHLLTGFKKVEVAIQVRPKVQLPRVLSRSDQERMPKKELKSTHWYFLKIFHKSSATCKSGNK